MTEGREGGKNERKEGREGGRKGERERGGRMNE